MVVFCPFQVSERGDSSAAPEPARQNLSPSLRAVSGLEVPSFSSNDVGEHGQDRRGWGAGRTRPVHREERAAVRNFCKFENKYEIISFSNLRKEVTRISCCYAST